MARSLTSRSTNPKIMDDNIKILDEAVQDAATPEADGVAYDNTDSGLAADNVQAALDEIVSALETVTVEGTTNTAGHISSAKLAANYAFIGTVTSESRIIIPFNSQSTGEIILKVLDTDLTPVISTAVSLSCKFLKL